MNRFILNKSSHFLLFTFCILNLYGNLWVSEFTKFNKSNPPSGINKILFDYLVDTDGDGVDSDIDCDDNDPTIGETPPMPTEDDFIFCYQTGWELVDCMWVPLGDEPNCADGCDITEDSFDEMTCDCINTPVCPNESCILEGTFFPALCTCSYRIITPTSCDDGDCFTADRYDPIACACVNTPIQELDCDDNDCNTEDTYNQNICQCVHVPIPEPHCDDNNCNTEDFYDDFNCNCVNVPRPERNCDDGCQFTNDAYDPTTCQCVNIVANNVCDDGCDITVDIYNATNCTCEYAPDDPVIFGCTDPNSENFNPLARCDDGSCFAFLPIELNYFRGTLIDNSVHMKWETTSEKNNAGFEIERSRDSRNWDFLKFIPGQENTDLITSYEWVDHTITSGKYYYRLKDVALDGDFTFTDIVSIFQATGTKIEVFPNPTAGIVKIQGLDANQSVEVLDWEGRILLQVEENAELDLSYFEAGIYFVRITNSDSVIVKKIIKLDMR